MGPLITFSCPQSGSYSAGYKKSWPVENCETCFSGGRTGHNFCAKCKAGYKLDD